MDDEVVAEADETLRGLMPTADVVIWARGRYGLWGMPEGITWLSVVRH